MKKLWCVMLALLLVGCGAEPTYETLGEVQDEPVLAPALEMAVDIPMDAVSEVMKTQDGSSLYFVGDYTVCMQTLESGDLNRSLEICTGFSRDRLQVMQTNAGGYTRYEAAWSCVSDQGDQVGRICILDDGQYHYALTMLTPAENANQVQEGWQTLLRSFRLEVAGSQVNTGS